VFLLHGFQAISSALAEWNGSISTFMKQLDKDKVPYISYSKISSVESCEYRYFLEYVEGIKVREPLYFKKGNIFHQAAGMAHRQLAKGKLNRKPIERLVDRHFEREDNRHLQNAIELLIQNVHTGFEVVDTELPFVLSLGRGLPPLIGIIDLLLIKGDVFLVVDHKTGKNFYEQDGLQLHLYQEYVRKTFKPKRMLACFDEYRWVNNLQRIRVPAFREPTFPIPASRGLSPLSGFRMVIRRFDGLSARARQILEMAVTLVTLEVFLTMPVSGVRGNCS